MGYKLICEKGDMNKITRELFMEHKLEGGHVELADLAGVEATDELVQCNHFCSIQLLRCQVVIFSNALPHRHHLLRQVILISEHHENHCNSH